MHHTRREFLRTASLAASGLLGGSALAQAAEVAGQPGPPPAPKPFKYSRDLRDGLSPRRVTNAMWDYSWLTQHYPGGAFADYSRAADELLERGFNTVRIDAYPLVIGSLRSERESVTIPANPLANWGGTDREREHGVASELIEFMTVMKNRGAHVILSSWGKDCKEYPNLRQSLAGNRTAFREAWERTLDLLGSHDLLSHVLYVDLDQEFPYFSPFKDGLGELGKGRSQATSVEAAMEEAGQMEPGATRLAWNPAQLEFVRSLFSELLPAFQSRYPGLRFTYSLTDFVREVRSLGLQLFDVLELHFWIHSPRFENRTGFGALKKDRGEHDYRDYARRLTSTIDAIGPMLFKAMENKMAYARAWADEAAAPLITSEAWGPWWHMDHPDLSWDWLQAWCEQCMTMAAEHQFWGVTPWNYSHPYWKNWSNVAWYRQVNQRFLQS